MPTIVKAPAKTAAKPKRAGQKTAPKVARQSKIAALETETSPKTARKSASSEVKAAKLKVPLVRDSFTMPAADFDLIAAMKLRALKLMRPTKKSELLRAGLHALAALNDTRFSSTLNALTPLKPGRPKKAD